MYKKIIEQDLKEAVKKLGFSKISDTVLSISENSQFGDYSSNVALQLSKLESKNIYHSSLEIANDLLEKFGHPSYLERVEIAGPGFLNFFLKDESLLLDLTSDIAGNNKEEKNHKRVLIEYASFNAFKPVHIGHLRNITTGESISRLLKYTGQEIFRVTYTSDIGLATAKALWGVEKLKTKYKEVMSKSLSEKARFLGEAYVVGSNAFEDDETIKKEIEEINRKLYQGDPETTKLWQETRNLSAAYLETIYSRLGTEFDAEVWESEVGEKGKQIVQQNIGKVFKEDQGAVIFPGEDHGLHTRVFINSDGNPTYEAKDVGLAFRQLELFPFDEAIHVVGNEQSAYFQVIIKAIELIEEQMLGKKRHLAYGFVNLSTGKMSSRKGNIVAAEDLIDQVKQKIREDFNKGDKGSDEQLVEKIAIGAVKFYLLKYALQTDIAFDVAQSIDLQGDTGVYVMYSYVRTQSVLNKANDLEYHPKKQTIEEEERSVLVQLEYWDYVIDQTVKTFQPTHLCEYLLNLSKAFNLFYERSPILGSEKEVLRLAITAKVGEVLKMGMYLLGIEPPERM